MCGYVMVLVLLACVSVSPSHGAVATAYVQFWLIHTKHLTVVS